MALLIHDPLQTLTLIQLRNGKYDGAVRIRNPQHLP
jgi:hypothetical protein